jgi:SAM-dependent methyltransferase
MQGQRYNSIGHGYARFRREDERFCQRILGRLGDAKTVANIGAGTGLYEPRDRLVLAFEPSDVMIAQRPSACSPAVRATAGNLPLGDRSVDAAMAILTLHHWDEEQERGTRELRRVSRGRVVIVTFDPRVSSRMWLTAEYLPELAAMELEKFPLPEQLAEWLGGQVTVETILIPRDTPDWTLASYWAHPERVFDVEARAATSGFARMPAPVIDRMVNALRQDLADGSWDDRHGHLRHLSEYDAGLRLVSTVLGN